MEDLASILLVSGILLLVSAFFSGSEAALFSLTPAWRRKVTRRPRTLGQRRLSRLLADPVGLLSTVIFANLVVNLAFSALSDRGIGTMADRITQSDAIRQVITIFGATLFLMIIGEVMPKLVGVRFSRQISGFVATPLSALYWLFRPLSRVMIWLDRRAQAGMNRLLPPEPSGLNESEVRLLASLGHKERHLDAFEYDLITNVISFADLEARHAMTPRTSMFALKDSIKVNRAIYEVRRKRHARIPTYDESIDAINGYVSYGALADLDVEDQKNLKLKKFREPVIFVPESKSLPLILDDFQAHETDFAIVVDEFGGTAGMITLNDIISRVLGRFDKASSIEGGRYITALDENQWMVRGDTPVEEIEKSLHVDLGDTEAETLAGVILEQLGQIPVSGDSCQVGDLHLDIRMVRQRRVELVRVIRQGS